MQQTPHTLEELKAGMKLTISEDELMLVNVTFLKDAKNVWTDCLFGIVVSTSDCHPRGPGFDS